MDVRRAILAMLRVPKRFLDWVYTDSGRRRPDTGEFAAHLRTGGMGMGTAAEIRDAEDARKRHIAAALDANKGPGT